MNRRQILELFKVNLLYANPQTTTQLRNKGKTGKKMFRGLLFQYTYMAVMFAALYGFIMLPVDFSKLPGFFTFYCLIFVVMSFAQSVSIYYNVFYESKDLQDYLPLPFQLNSVFFAKFMIVGLTVLPFVLPVLVLFVITGLRSKVPFLLSIPLSLVLFALFFVIVLSLSILIVSFLVQTAAFTRHKNILTTALLLVPMIGMVGGMLYLNLKQTAMETGGGFSDQPILYPFFPFYKLLAEPFTPAGLISLAGILALCFLMYQVIQKVVIPRMYAYTVNESKAQNSTSRKKAGKNTYRPLKKQLFLYNLSLIRNPTLLIQILTFTIILPVCMLFGFIAGSNRDLSGLSMDNWVLSLMGGFIYTFITLSSNSIASVIISLDRENLLYIRSLPISFKDYLKEKFLFAVKTHFSLTGLVIIVFGLFTHLPFAYILGALLGDFLSIMIISQYYFYRDYRFMTLNWTSISQLFSRGAGNMVVMLTMLGMMIFGGILFLVAWLLASLHPLLTALAFLAVMTGGAVFTTWHYKKVFWRSL